MSRTCACIERNSSAQFRIIPHYEILFNSFDILTVIYKFAMSLAINQSERVRNRRANDGKLTSINMLARRSLTSLIVP
jgi:hypothetical protein